MTALTRPDEIEQRLRALNSPDKLSRFFAELDYERAEMQLPLNEQLDQLGVTPRIVNRTDDTPDAFKIIYTPLQNLSRSTERAVISKLLPWHPYALFVFSDANCRAWHFVNVKLIATGDARDAKVRRLFRRISVSADDRLRTASERLAMLDLSRLQSDMFISPLVVQKLHDDAFDVEAVTRQFFSEYRRIFEAAEVAISGIQGDARRIFTQRLFNRLMFILFLERKGWLRLDGQPDHDYLKALWLAHQSSHRADFYTERLKPLFFAGLNTPNEVDIAGIHPKGALQAIIGNVPYLNGGLFEQTPEDDSPAIRVSDAALKPALTDLFYRYNFTVTESTPFDAEVAVDPEMLGKIFEELIVGRHESGSYYTPKTVVSFMCRTALKSYLQTRCTESDAALDAFLEDDDARHLRDPERILDALRAVRVCDPACGSGAYLLGMMQELLRLRRALFDSHRVDDLNLYKRKLEIIQRNLYGVDKDPFAVNIARLRLWLSLMVDYNNGSRPPPLPNLDYKIEVGDSLTAPAPTIVHGSGVAGVQIDLVRAQQIQHYYELKGAYLSAHGTSKQETRQKIDAQRETIRQWMLADRRLKHVEGFDWQVEFAEIFAAEKTDERGFDIVLANPPYIRHELIADQKSALKQTYGKRYTGAADLYVYFYLRALELLKPNGTLCFISSNKWLRAAYGKTLRAELAQHAQLQHLIDFGDLPVFGAIAYPLVLTARKAPPSADHTFRALPVRSLQVLENLPAAINSEGFAQPQGSLPAEGWTLAPSDTLALLGKLRANGTPLGEYVEGAIYRGVLTGYNEAFVIDRATRDRLIAEDPKSAQIIKPFLRGRDIKRWHAAFAEQYLIFTRRGISIDKYPAIKRHLLQYKDRLVPDGKGGRKVGSYQWYEIQDNIAYYAEFEKPKIVWGNLATKPQFTQDIERFYVNAPANILVVRPNDLSYLLGVLNSRTSQYFIDIMAAERQGGFVEYKPMYISQIPIPSAPQALRDQIGSLAQKLTKLRGQGAEAAALEAQLNALVYQAYGLTEAEIALIEESLKG
ncbi:MAG: class I SAM-dependent DNA methyltransferase [Chloroflexi bacterium CFX4]|nr:class I SAM-dependent DNA methyltransferase [Chloroflexi bacterium CFX4]MDL1923926.1 class I SAM-dependent DNA methyltransferase [Chloroflexi bacterium CFX3]